MDKALFLVCNFQAEEQIAHLTTHIQILNKLVPTDGERLAIFRHLYNGHIESDFGISEQAYAHEVLEPIEAFLERGLIALKERHRQNARPSANLLNSCHEMSASIPNTSEMQAQLERLKSKAFGLTELLFLCQTMPSADVSVHLQNNAQSRIMCLLC